MQRKTARDAGPCVEHEQTVAFAKSRPQHDSARCNEWPQEEARGGCQTQSEDKCRREEGQVCSTNAPDFCATYQDRREGCDERPGKGESRRGGYKSIHA